MKSSEPGTARGGARAPLTIGAVAGRFGVAAHVLRHWESMGLLAPARDAAGRRRYGPADLTRVAFVLRAKEAGLSLATIRALAAATGAADAEERRTLLREEAAALRSALAAARTRLALVECALGCAHEDVTRCPRFQQIVAERVGPEAAVRAPAGRAACAAGRRHLPGPHDPTSGQKGLPSE